MLGERRSSSLIEMTGETGDTGKDRERLHVEIGALAVPGFDDDVDVVHGPMVSQES